MKALTTYESRDGSRFDDEKKCRDYELLCAAVDSAMSHLPPDRDDIKSEQYVRYTKEASLAAKSNLVRITKTQFEWCPEAFKVPPDEIHPRGLVGRIVDDSGIKCLQRAWGRLSRINWDLFRQYERPYFAANPDKAIEEIP